MKITARKNSMHQSGFKLIREEEQREMKKF